MIPKSTAKEISDIIVAQFEAQFNQTIPLFPRAFNRVIAKVCGLVFVAFSQFAGFMFLQQYVRYASDKPLTIGGQTIIPLDELGQLIGLSRRRGIRAEGNVTVTSSVNTTLLSGTQLINTINGQVYIVLGDQAVTVGSNSVLIRATSYSTAASFVAGTELAFVSAPSGINKNVLMVLDGATVQGQDPESTEEWRDRQLTWWANRPQGGAYADYREWGTAVDGVKQIYPYTAPTSNMPGSRIGCVDIYVKADNETGIADQDLLDAVAANIEQTASTGLANRRPINALPLYASVTTVNFSVSISQTLPISAELQADIEEAVQGYFTQRENYIPGLSRLPRRDVVSASDLRGVVGRVAAANGTIIDTVNLFNASLEWIDAYALQEGEQADVTSISWI